MRGVPVDRQQLHVKIWEARDKSGKVKIYQKKFAEAQGLSPYHMSRIIRDFEKEGRLRKVGARYRNIGIYVVADPGQFDGTAGLESP